ncbi:MAG: hypothetical protein ACREHG_00865, partial [Candidatus Saccharimonadales bacterium]
DFATSAIKTYLVTIFVLFVHVVILMLAASIFTSRASGSASGQPDPLMALVVGLATLTALLKTQGFMAQLSYMSIGPKTARRLGTQLVSSLSSMSRMRPAARGAIR